MRTLKLIWIIVCAIIGAAVGAVLLGSISFWLSVPGAVVGLIIGGLLGRYIAFWEWFA